MLTVPEPSVSRSPFEISPDPAPRSKFNVVRLDVVNPFNTSVPAVPTPPGAIVCAPDPASTFPPIAPPDDPLARMPPFNVTLPVPVADPFVNVLLTINVPALIVVPPV